MNLHQVLNATAQVFQVSADDLKSSSRKPPLPLARRLYTLTANHVLEDVKPKEIMECIHMDRCAFYKMVSRALDEIELYPATKNLFNQILNQLTSCDSN